LTLPVHSTTSAPTRPDFRVEVDPRVASSAVPAVTLIPGDGIGPEVVAATRRVIEAAGVRIAWEEHVAGRAVFAAGDATGVPSSTIESIARTKVALKGPLETPIGSGGKSANVTLRKMFETYGNTRPARIYPGIKTPFSDRAIDLVVVRENVEDLYAGIEYMATPGVAQALKLISVKGCEKICRMGFDLALAEGRKKVTCVTKANILKLTEGMLQRTFERVALEYPQLQTEFMLVDNAAHQLVRKPEAFDVMVMTNMNGDILSDLVSGLVGGLGIAPGANLGRHAAIFEAVHGTAPDIAGQDKANPTATLLSGVMMLRHLGFYAQADSIEAAVAVTLAEGPRTGDIANGLKPAGTLEFTAAIIRNLGRAPVGWKARSHQPLRLAEVSSNPVAVVPKSRRLLGMDLFIESGQSAGDLGPALERLAEGLPMYLKVLSNRGQVVYPLTGAPTDCVDQWRARFELRPGVILTDRDLWSLQLKVAERFQINQWNRLEELDGARGYTLAQGEE
jgi:isocitrate dehydrogenase